MTTSLPSGSMTCRLLNQYGTRCFPQTANCAACFGTCSSQGGYADECHNTASVSKKLQALWNSCPGLKLHLSAHGEQYGMHHTRPSKLMHTYTYLKYINSLITCSDSTELGPWNRIQALHSCGYCLEFYRSRVQLKGKAAHCYCLCWFVIAKQLPVPAGPWLVLATTT